MLPSTLGKMQIVLPPLWNCVKKMCSDVEQRALYDRQYPTPISFAMKDAREVGDYAVKFLRGLIKSELNKDTLRWENGHVVRKNTGRFYNSIRIVGPRRMGSIKAGGAEGPGVEVGCMDMRAARQLKPNGYNYRDGRYYEILEQGVAPFQMSRQQQKTWFMILKRIHAYDPGVARALGPTTEQMPGNVGVMSKGENRFGSMHPGIRPYKFFERTSWVMYNMSKWKQSTFLDRFLRYATPRHKMTILTSAQLSGGKGFAPGTYRVTLTSDKFSYIPPNMVNWYR